MLHVDFYKWNLSCVVLSLNIAHINLFFFAKFLHVDFFLFFFSEHFIMLNLFSSLNLLHDKFSFVKTFIFIFFQKTCMLIFSSWNLLVVKFFLHITCCMFVVLFKELPICYLFLRENCRKLSFSVDLVTPPPPFPPPYMIGILKASFSYILVG